MAEKKRRLLLRAGGALLLLAVGTVIVLATAPLLRPVPGGGGGASITVRSTPAGALVRVNGVERGRTPLTLAVPADVLLQVSVVGITGFAPRHETLVLSPGEARTVLMPMVPGLGSP